MRFSYVAISSSSAYALSAYINPSAKNPNCVYNVDDCNSMSGNCCANQELCGVQECLLHVMTVSNIQFDNKTNSPISNVKKHSDIFFGSETVIEGSKNFCDDEFTFYGQIEELKLWCDPVQGRVKGISARHGPKPGESKYAWSMIHGSSNNEPEDEKWLLWGHNISEIKIGYSEEMGIQAIQFFYDRSRTPVCGNFDPENEIKTSSIVFDNEEACKIDYLAGNENEDGGINGLTFHFDCK